MGNPVIPCHPHLRQEGIDAVTAIDEPQKMDSGGSNALNKLRIGAPVGWVGLGPWWSVHHGAPKNLEMSCPVSRGAQVKLGEHHHDSRVGNHFLGGLVI